MIIRFAALFSLALPNCCAVFSSGIASSKWVRDCIQGGKYGFALPAVMVLKEVSGIHSKSLSRLRDCWPVSVGTLLLLLLAVVVRFLFSLGASAVCIGHLPFLAGAHRPPPISRHTPCFIFTLKVLCQRGLNQPWSGGLSSYSLINMMITVLQRAEVERARARRIVACAQAAAQAHAAARGVRQGSLAPPVALPQQQGVMGPLPPPPPPPPPPPTSEAAPAHGVVALNHETQGQEMTGSVVVSDQQVGGGGGDAATSMSGVGAGTSTSTSGSAAGDPRPKSPEKVAASGDALSDCGAPVSTGNPCDEGKSDGNGTGNGASAGTETPPAGGDGVGGECQEDSVPAVPDAATAADDDEQKPAPAPPAMDSTLSQEEKPSSSSLLVDKSAETTDAAAQGGDGSTAPGAGVVADHAAHPSVAAEVPAGESVGVTRAPTPPLVPAAGSVASAPAVMLPVQAGQQQQQQQQQRVQQQQQQQQGAAMLPSAAQQAQYNLGMNADLFHMKHMEINLSQEEVERADLRSESVSVSVLAAGSGRGVSSPSKDGCAVVEILSRGGVSQLLFLNAVSI